MGDSANTTASASTTSQPAQNNYGAQAVTLAGGLTSAYAQYTAGQYNKKILRQNAAVARVQADEAIEAGNFAGGRAVARERMVEGADASAAAAGGTVAGAGTNRRVIESNRAASAMDRVMIDLNARRQAYGYQARAAGDEASANMEARKGDMNASATLLNTGAQELLEGDPAYSGMRGRGIQF